MSGHDDAMGNIAQIIETTRVERGLTQQQLASRAGFNSTQAYSNKVGSQGGSFSVEQLIRLSEVLEIDPMGLVFAQWPDLADAANELAEFAEMLRHQPADALDRFMAQVRELADSPIPLSQDQRSTSA